MKLAYGQVNPGRRLACNPCNPNCHGRLILGPSPIILLSRRLNCATENAFYMGTKGRLAKLILAGRGRRLKDMTMDMNTQRKSDYSRYEQINYMSVLLESHYEIHARIFFFVGTFLNPSNSNVCIPKQCKIGQRSGCNRPEVNKTD